MVMLCWGVRAYFMKAANAVMSAESIFVYMMIAGARVDPDRLGDDRLFPSR